MVATIMGLIQDNCGDIVDVFAYHSPHFLSQAPFRIVAKLGIKCTNDTAIFRCLLRFLPKSLYFGAWVWWYLI